MALTWERIKFLNQLKGGQQFGTDLVSLEPVNGTTKIAAVGKNLIRWEGEGDWDLYPWRIYLSPFSPADTSSPGSNIDTMMGASALLPSYQPQQAMRPNVGRYSVWAEISWAVGLRTNTAWVDWPTRGGLVQVSGRYVTVQALVIGQPTGAAGVNLSVGANLAVEPGGGDSSAPGTFTCPIISATDLDASTGLLGANFMVPPFARTVRPILPWADMLTGSDSLTVPTQIIARQRTLDASSPTNDTFLAQKYWNVGVSMSPSDVDSIDSTPWFLNQQAAYVRFEFAPTTGGEIYQVGCLFELDL